MRRHIIDSKWTLVESDHVPGLDGVIVNCNAPGQSGRSYHLIRGASLDVDERDVDALQAAFGLVRIQ